jgi:NitT/TauT family transport system substrate-binding protein
MATRSSTGVTRFRFPDSENAAMRWIVLQAGLISRKLLVIGMTITLGVAVSGPASAEAVKIGVLRVAGAGPLFVAHERGYFAAEGLSDSFVYFDASQPIAVATVSGDVDFGVTPATAGFYSLAGQGVLRIIAGSISEAPTFHANTIVASNAAYAGGLHSLKDIGGHAVGTNQVGSAPHYALALIAEHFGIDMKTIRVVPLQSNPNQVSAMIGGQIDVSMTPSTYVMPAIQKGQGKLLGFVGDVTPWQLGATFTSTKMANEHRDTVERFLRAMIKGTHDYHDAFTGPGEKRQDMPSAPEILAIIAKYVDQPAEQLKESVSYTDPDARLDYKDILHQLAWYQSQGMVKDSVKGDAIIDTRYAVPMPARE